MFGLMQQFQGESLMARALRSASWLLMGYGSGQVLRLASNLILTRLLFAEAFGMMALVSVITIGLTLFSDIGVGPSIALSKRGDDPKFLDTAWTIQVIRGFLLWGVTLAMAGPVARFYDAPDLALYLPLAGIALIISGFKPTRIETAYRHLLTGRVTAIELASQAISLAFMVLVAVITKSVVALVLGGLVFAMTELMLAHYFLPGHRNRLRWNKIDAHELIHFGKWIFLSTAFWFVTSQGDRAILGKFISLETLGIYNVAFVLASFPMALGYAVNQRLMIPIYRDKPAKNNPENRRSQRLLRYGLTGGLLCLVWFMALTGPWLVNLLYDDRYALAGTIIVLLALSSAPAVIVMTYDQAALAAGDSRLFFVMTASRAIVQTALFLGGVMWLGLPGGVLATGVAMVLVYPILIWLAIKHHVWDPVHDLVYAIATAGITVLALWLHWPLVLGMFQQLHP